MAELVIDLLETMQIQRDEAEGLGVALGPIQFFFERFLKEAAIGKPSERIGNSTDFEFFKIVAFDENRKTKKIGRSEYVDKSSLQGNGLAEIRGKRLSAQENFVPELNGFFFGKIEMSQSAKKAAEELRARRMIKWLQRLDDDFEKTGRRGRTKLDRRAGAGQI